MTIDFRQIKEIKAASLIVTLSGTCDKVNNGTLLRFFTTSL